MRRPVAAFTTVLAVALAGAGAVSAQPPAEGGVIVDAPHTIVVHKGDIQLTIPVSVTNVSPNPATGGGCVFDIPELALSGGIGGELGPGETTSGNVVIDVPSDRISRLTLEVFCFFDIANTQTVMVVRTGPLGG